MSSAIGWTQLQIAQAHSGVVECAPEDLEIGMRLRMRTEPVTDEVSMAVFASE